MFCEAYNQSVKDAAASGEALSPVLQQHLASCESCRSAFVEEQSLFAAIDSSLRTAANSEVPATLIPRVRVALNNEPAPQSSGFNFLVWGSAGAFVTAAVAIALLAPSHHPSNSPKVAAKAAPSARPAENSPAAVAVNPPPTRGVFVVHRTRPVVLSASDNSWQEFPEVIVPPDESVALLRYEQFLRRKPAIIQMASVGSIDSPHRIEPLLIAEIELVNLNIPALSKWESEDDTK